MSIKLMIWIILAVVYALSRLKKKPEIETPPTRQPNPPISFDDLLREIQAKNKKPIAPPVLEPTHETHTTDFEDESKPLEQTDYQHHDSIYETYEKARQEAFLRPSLEETMKLNDTVVKFNQFKEYEKDAAPSLAATLGKELQDQQNFRKAFVLSEILQRRF